MVLSYYKHLTTTNFIQWIAMLILHCMTCGALGLDFEGKILSSVFRSYSQ